MSAKATAKVWEFSRAKGSELLVMLCYADYAHDDGTGACPSLKTLMAKTRLTRNGVREVRDRLVAKGEIYIRPEPSRYDTEQIDILYGDGSNQAVIQGIHGPCQTLTISVKVLPKSSKFAPDSSVVVSSESLSESESDNTTTEIGVKDLQNRQSLTSAPTSTVEPTEVDALLAEWEACGVAGEYLHPIAERILARPNCQEELDDLLDYWRLWNQRVPDRPLGPAWLASELRRLSTLSQNTERQHHWCDYLPPEPARPEYWQPYAGPVDLPAPEPEPISPAAVLWQQALDELALTMPTPTFEVALRPVRAVALDGDTLTLQVRDGWQTWLERLARDIRRALARVADRPINFYVEVAPPPSREERAA